MNEDNLSILNNRIPNEILETILKLLSPESFMTCRAVCRKWKHIIDYMINNETLWQKHCELNYGDICHSVYKNSTPGLSWSQVYKSLTLWARLSHSRETINELYLTMDYFDHCLNCQVLSNRIVGVLRVASLEYYNIDTLQQLQELTLTNDHFYYTYRENDDVILLLSTSHELSVRRKENREKTVKTFTNVYLCDIIENDIYYVTCLNIVYKLTYVNGSFINNRIGISPNFVISFGHEKGILYIMTSGFNIYSYVDETFRTILFNGSCREKFEGLRRYNFAKDSSGMCMQGVSKFFFCKEEKEQNINLLMIHTHGPVLFAGTKNCTLRIFHSLYNTSIVDLLKTKPLKVLHLIKPQEKRLISQIINIVALEEEQGHTVLVAMTTKIVIIKFTHLLNSEEASRSPEILLGISGLHSSRHWEPPIFGNFDDKELSTSEDDVSTSTKESSSCEEESGSIRKSPTVGVIHLENLEGNDT